MQPRQCHDETRNAADPDRGAELVQELDRQKQPVIG